MCIVIICGKHLVLIYCAMEIAETVIEENDVSVGKILLV